jgi:hypothetical protein
MFFYSSQPLLLEFFAPIYVQRVKPYTRAAKYLPVRVKFLTLFIFLFLPLHRAFLRFIYHYTPTNAPNLFTI